MENTPSIPKLVSFNKWLADVGVTPTTGWRWRKKGILKTTNVYGRLYISETAAAEFFRRATAGEFAVESKPGGRAATN